MTFKSSSYNTCIRSRSGRRAGDGSCISGSGGGRSTGGGSSTSCSSLFRGLHSIGTPSK